MTEDVWLAAGHAGLGGLVHDANRLGNPRKMRLFNCACARLMLPWVQDDQVEAAITRSEQYADGEIARSTMVRWARVVRQALDRIPLVNPPHVSPAARPQWARRKAYWVCVLACHPGPPVETNGWRYLVHHDDAYGPEFEQTVQPRLAPTLRDVFGNPFRPVAFDPDWRTDTAVTLARQMYEAREFSAMPVLADALQDAGCEDAAILTHCRDPQGSHVRGCWVVDLVLGKA